MIALRSFVGARENCRRFGVALPAGFDERLTRACEFARDCRRPDGTIPALSDSDTGDYDELLDARRAAAGPRRPARRRSRHFADGGYFVQRAGERYLIFDCGPLGDGGHGHYDALSVEAWAGERALVLDPGRFTYAEGEPNLRHWFRGTAAHNTVSVDGADQTPYARSRSSLPAAEARLLEATRRRRLIGEVRCPVYEAVHRRRVIFVDGRYWLIEDVLTGERPHRYDLRCHLAPGARPSCGRRRHLAHRRDHDPRRAQDRARGRLDLAALRRSARPRRCVSAVATGDDARFVTLLAPREPARRSRP